ncbi:MAG: diguanylate cyclase [Oscillospiraceae bacterium]|jgi:diguanylate cyclase (GGDEF)-like protein|nr:diguanylate cyclase [Oscillospiraceae bacterium]
MFGKGVRSRIILPTVIVIIALTTVTNITLLSRYAALGDELAASSLSVGAHNLAAYLADLRLRTRAAAAGVAGNPEISRALAAGDVSVPETVLSLALELYEVDHIFICDKEGNALQNTRPGAPAGDDLPPLTAHDALAGVVSTHYEQTSHTKLAMHSGAPVYGEAGEIIGSVVAGMRLDTLAAAEEMKLLLGVEVSVYADGQRVVSTLGYGAEERHRSEYFPLYDRAGDSFASICLSVPLESRRRERAEFIRAGVFVGAAGLAAVLALMYFLISGVGKPMIALAKNMERFAEGDLSFKIEPKGGGELARLERSLLKAVDTIRSLLGGIQEMIIRQEKGNTDYILDHTAFKGDYKLLAVSISRLSSLGMRDHLTGLPNRRSFDNRITAEWNRARRDGTVLSVLMLDLDRFKQYNDTYGHKQGDEALKAVAATLSRSVKRTGDFVARWGGEEFVALLADTSSEGAASLAEVIRASVENLVINTLDALNAEGGDKITVSVGVCTQRPRLQSCPDELIAKADEALYAAKSAGRNRVSVVKPPPPVPPQPPVC